MEYYERRVNIIDRLGEDEVIKSKIKVKLAELEIQQKDLAKELNLANQTLNGWATGRIKPPLEKAFMLAKRLNCKVDDLWEYKEE